MLFPNLPDTLHVRAGGLVSPATLHTRLLDVFDPLDECGSTRRIAVRIQGGPVLTTAQAIQAILPALEDLAPSADFEFSDTDRSGDRWIATAAGESLSFIEHGKALDWMGERMGFRPRALSGQGWHGGPRSGSSLVLSR